MLGIVSASWDNQIIRYHAKQFPLNTFCIKIQKKKKGNPDPSNVSRSSRALPDRANGSEWNQRFALVLLAVPVNNLQRSQRYTRVLRATLTRRISWNDPENVGVCVGHSPGISAGGEMEGDCPSLPCFPSCDCGRGLVTDEFTRPELQVRIG